MRFIDAGERRRFLVRLGQYALGALSSKALLGCATPNSAADDASTKQGWVDSESLLRSLVQTIFPGPKLDTSHYDRVVEKLEKLASDPEIESLITSGLNELANARWHEQSAEQRVASLKAIESTPFFQFVRYQTVTSLYSDHRVWQLYGYQGESLSQGGYLSRGFNDIDWLPEPGS